MLFSESVRILSTIGLCFSVYFNLNPIIFILFLIFDTIGRCLYQPSYQKSIYLMTSDDNRVRSNSISQTVGEVSSVIAPLIFSFLIIFVNKYQVLIITALLYLLSLLSIFMINFSFFKMNYKRISAKEILKDNWLNINSIKLENFSIFYIITISAVCILFTGAILRFVLQENILKIYDERVIGYVFSCMSFGALLGGLFLSKRHSRQNSC